MSKSSKAVKFPLHLHSTGQWRKKIRGRHHYFGTDQDQALAEWLRVKDDLLAGRAPKAQVVEGCELMTLCNTFLTHQQSKVESGELSQRGFYDYHRMAKRMIDHFGKHAMVESLTPEVLIGFRRKLAKTLSPATLGVQITLARMILRFAHINCLTSKPVEFGDFKKPAKRAVRKARAAGPKRMFTREKILGIMEGCNAAGRTDTIVQMRAMVFLGINCAFGNHDVGQLPVAAVDLDRGWIDFPRPKTAIDRRSPLWPETISALQDAADVRADPDDRLFFRNRIGEPWYRDSNLNPVAEAFRRICRNLGLYEQEMGFYCFRRTFQTVADTQTDSVAIKMIMGHDDTSMSAIYRQQFPDDRLVAVSDHVREWLFDGTNKS